MQIDGEGSGEQLTLEEFTEALLAGAELWWLRERADILLDAADTLVREQQPMTRERYAAGQDSPHALSRTLQSIVRCMRADINPFTGVLEAPRSVAELYQQHDTSVREAESARTRALEPLLRDAASAWFDCLTAPIMWSDLEARGVPRQPPAPPEPDDFDYW